MKPENILLHISSSYPRILIADFGHATSHTNILDTISESEQELENQIANPIPVENVGTSNYLPPERLYSLSGRDPAIITLSKKKRGASGIQSRREELATKLLEREIQLDIWALGCQLPLAVSFGGTS
jgi:serine/threonine protein kinase